MMKKALYIFALAAIIVSGCKKDEAPVLDDPDTRLAAVLSEYQNTLLSAPGWRAHIAPRGGKSFSFFVKFENDGKVNMISDFNATASEVSKESTYRLKALQRPTLIFDTYSYIHMLSDPNSGVSTGATGLGLISDFEFGFSRVTADSIYMEGTFNGNQLILVRATPQEATAYASGALKTIVTASTAYISQNPFVYLQVDGVKVQVSINPTTKVITLAYVENNEVRTASSTFSFTSTGIRTDKPITYKDKSFQELLWDAGSSTYYVNLAGTRSNVLISSTPIVPLHLLLGVEYNAITVPQTANAGWSADFTTKRATAAAAILAGPYKLTLGTMAFTFNTSLKTMTINAIVFQGANPFTASFPYTYTKTADGSFDFTALSPAGNAALIVNEMKPLTDRIRDDIFVLDYFSSPTTGVLGQFRSVTTPAFFFAGTLSK